MSSATKRLVLKASLVRAIAPVLTSAKDLVLYELLHRPPELSRQVKRVSAFSRVREKCIQ